MKKPASSAKFKKAANENGAPTDFAGQLIYFKNIPENSKFATLKDALLLTSEHEKTSDYIFGYVLNKPFSPFHRYIEQKNLSVKDYFHFIQLMHGAVPDFAILDSEFVSFIFRKDVELLIPHQETVGPFAIHTCDTLEEAALMANWLSDHEDVVMVNDQFIIDRNELVNLLTSGQAFSTPASTDIVFNRSAFMRTALAFPQFFDKSLFETAERVLASLTKGP